jgi:hypothetical protein
MKKLIDIVEIDGKKFVNGLELFKILDAGLDVPYHPLLWVGEMIGVHGTELDECFILHDCYHPDKFVAISTDAAYCIVNEIKLVFCDFDEPLYDELEKLFIDNRNISFEYAKIAKQQDEIKTLKKLLGDRMEQQDRIEELQWLLKEAVQPLDESKKWYSIRRYAKENKLNWRDINKKMLDELSYEHEIEVKKIFDANYGEVNIYHKKMFEILNL